MKEKLINLIEVKKLIALMLAVTFVYLAIIGKIGVEQFMAVFFTVIGVYFGQSTSRQSAREAREQ